MRITHRGETSDLVAKTLGGDDSHLLRNPLVDSEIERQARVVLLDDLARSLLHGFGANATLWLTTTSWKLNTHVYDYNTTMKRKE